MLTLVNTKAKVTLNLEKPLNLNEQKLKLYLVIIMLFYNEKIEIASKMNF